MNALSDEIFESDYEDSFEGEADFEAGDFEGDFEGEQEYGYEVAGAGFGESESPFSEEEELELGAELLAVSHEQELDQFLGKLVRRVAPAAGKFFRSPTGRALGALLRQTAKRALPIAGRAIGTAFGGPVGGAIGSRLATAGGRIFGLELEGLSAEDQELQMAQRYVRLASDAVAKAAQAPPSNRPMQAARAALAASARVHAPGLLRPAPSWGGAAGARPRPRTGRWIRRGRRILVLGV